LHKTLAAKKEVRLENEKMNLLKFLETDHKNLIRAHDVAEMMGVSLETVYDWKYRAKKKCIPNGTFVKINEMLFIRSDLLRAWITSKMKAS
jgi:predicted DNA-binding transcriptional regulator AlpA